MNTADTPPPEERSALDWAGRTGTTGALLRELQRRANRRRRNRLLAAAGTLTAVCAAVFLWPRPANVPVIEQTARLERVIVRQPGREILTDGSVVELRAQARIRTDFSVQTRWLVLERGEAHFQVAKTPDRPFVVEANGVHVRAVGTAFAVRPDGPLVEVIVTEGRVAVELPAGDSAGRTLATLDAGSRVVVNTRARTAVVTEIPSGQLNEVLAWRIPRLEFTDTRLSEVIEAFNRHNAGRLELADDADAGLRLSGIIRADNTEALLQLLESTYGIKGERRGQDVVLRRGP